MKIRKDGVYDIGNHIPAEEADGNFVGIAKFSKKGADILIKEMAKMVKDEKHDNSYYIIAIIEIAKSKRISYEAAGDEPWMEIDFLKDYEKAKNETYPLVKQ